MISIGLEEGSLKLSGTPILTRSSNDTFLMIPWRIEKKQTDILALSSILKLFDCYKDEWLAVSVKTNRPLPLHSPYINYVGLTCSRYLQVRSLKWPLIFACVSEFLDLQLLIIVLILRKRKASVSESAPRNSEIWG